MRFKNYQGRDSFMNWLRDLLIACKSVFAFGIVSHVVLDESITVA